jgi:hypothetical protein
MLPNRHSVQAGGAKRRGFRSELESLSMAHNKEPRGCTELLEIRSDMKKGWLLVLAIIWLITGIGYETLIENEVIAMGSIVVANIWLVAFFLTKDEKV